MVDGPWPIEIEFEEREISKSNEVFPPPPPLPGQSGQSGHLSGFAKDSELNGIATAKSAINIPEIIIVCWPLFTNIFHQKNI